MNSIRTPRQGKTTASRRIAEAVDDESWQKFRLSLKGKTTEEKLCFLRMYFNEEHGIMAERQFFDMKIHLEGWMGCDICVRTDNYIKALCRGGQLYAGESLETALTTRPSFNLRIKRN